MTQPSFLERMPERLRHVLVRASPEALARAERFLANAGAPCVYFQSERVSDQPLRRGALGRLLGKPVAAPTLPVLQSKCGGVPYVTEEHLPLMKDRHFLLQINLAEVPSPPVPLPRRGLFCVDMLRPTFGGPWFGVRFYPEPTEAAAVRPAAPVECVGKYEASIRFLPGTSYPADEWSKAFEGEDDALQDAWSDCESEIDYRIRGDRPTRDDVHCLGGHWSVRSEDTELRPPAGYPPPDRGGYEQLLRLDYDNGADFAWGSNAAYVYIHRDDLAAGRLERAFDTPANY